MLEQPSGFIDKITRDAWLEMKRRQLGESNVKPFLPLAYLANERRRRRRAPQIQPAPAPLDSPARDISTMLNILLFSNAELRPLARAIAAVFSTRPGSKEEAGSGLQASGL